jgi:hypothetical protein
MLLAGLVLSVTIVMYFEVFDIRVCCDLCRINSEMCKRGLSYAAGRHQLIRYSAGRSDCQVAKSAIRMDRMLLANSKICVRTLSIASDSWGSDVVLCCMNRRSKNDGLM